VSQSFVKIPQTVEECRHLIGGEWSADAQEWQDARSPWTGEVIARVPLASREVVARAVAAGQRAFEVWGRTPLKERTQLLFRFRELVLRDLEVLSHAAAAESGKTVAEGRAGVLKGLEVAEFALSLQNLDDGGAMDVSRGVSCELRRMPLGVVAGIAPFNFPAMVPMWMYPIAVTLGNCFILKPSEKVPRTAMRMAELMTEAGYPAGVFQIVHGGREAVEALCDHPGVRAVGFVGSTPIARAVYERAAQAGKRALALGGAKNLVLVVPDADPKITIDGVVRSATGCAGQRCMAASLMVGVGGVDKLVEQIASHAGSLVLGEDMGALISAESKARIDGIIERAVADGARLLVDGRGAKPPAGCEGGYWMGPTIIDGATPEMECAREEIFGPVLTIVRASNLTEAMALENASPYGNATSVFTTRGDVARFVAERASNGMIGINIGVPVPREPFSFGGTKASKFGYGDITGRGCLDFWSDLKKITTKWEPQADQSWMS
jgi:malonate-semialdehyde dehydrogenase (acetylating) / methylmalonate-semialdehyde dehydrogenase